MYGLPLLDRMKLAWKALATPWDQDGAKLAHGLLGGILSGTRGTMPDRSTEALLQTFNTSPWVRACAGRVADAMAAVQWTLSVPKKPTGEVRHDLRYIQKAGREARRTLMKNLQRVGELSPVEEHLFLDVMTQGNRYFTGRDIRWLMSLHFDLAGDVFLLKERNKVKGTAALWPVPPHWVAETPSPSAPFFRMSHRAWQVRIPQDEVLWMPNPNPVNPYGRGTGLAKAVDDNIANEEYATKHTAAFFRNSARPDVLVMPKEGSAMSEADQARFEQFWRDNLQGFWKSFKPLFLKAPVEVKTLEQNFRNLQMKELRDQERDIIVQTWGIPPELFGILSSSNRSTIDMAPFIFATYVLIPRLERLRDVLQYRLIREYDENLILDYVSPVPEDKNFKLQVMTHRPDAFFANEFRELAGYEPEDELDDVLMSQAGPNAAPPAEDQAPEATEAEGELNDEDEKQLDRLLFKMSLRTKATR